MNITHITIDFWNTIFKSNPDFAKWRNHNLLKYLTDRDVWPLHVIPTVEGFSSIYQDTKVLVNQLEFNWGRSIPVKVKHAIFFDKLGVDSKHLTDEYFDIQTRLFKDHPPIPMHRDTLDIITELSNNYDVTILSNTGMVANSLLRDFITNGNEEYRFSDDSVHCKPSIDFFNEHYHETMDLKSFGNWLHIGDDYERDIVPAKSLKIKAFLLTQPADWLNLKTLLL